MKGGKKKKKNEQSKGDDQTIDSSTTESIVKLENSKNDIQSLAALVMELVH